jgi:hypothetical protein
VPGAFASGTSYLLRPVTLLDEVMPAWDARETHAIASSRPLDEILETPLASDPLVRVLLRLRGLGTSGTILSLGGGRFRTLAQNDQEIVLGVAGTPWRPGGGLIDFASDRPGIVRIAIDFRADGTTVSTETRVAAVDEAARRAFLRYWRVVGPFSALIRRRWLKKMAA